jgi:hypothetical protein
MGLLNKITGFFDSLRGKEENKKEEAEKTAVKIDELNGWLEENKRGKGEKIRYATDEIFRELGEIIGKTREDIQKLREAEIRRVADERLVTLVKQQRDIYAKLTEEFTGDILKNKNEKEIIEFVGYYAKRTSRFSKQSFKPFHVTSELVGKPLESIIKDLKSIDQCVKRFSKIIKDELAGINNLERLADEARKKIREKDEYQENLKEILIYIDETNEKIKYLQEKDENIRKSGGYIEKERLRREIDEISHETRLKKESIIVSFSKIKRALRKFEWIEKNKHRKELLARLAEETVETVMAGKAGEINELLDKLAIKVNEKEINENILSEIENAKNSLKITDEIRRLDSNLQDLREKERNMIIESNENKIQGLGEEIKKSGKIRQNYETKIEEINSSLFILKRGISEKTRQILGKEIEII